MPNKQIDQKLKNVAARLERKRPQEFEKVMEDLAAVDNDLVIEENALRDQRALRDELQIKAMDAYADIV